MAISKDIHLATIFVSDLSGLVGRLEKDVYILEEIYKQLSEDERGCGLRCAVAAALGWDPQKKLNRSRRILRDCERRLEQLKSGKYQRPNMVINDLVSTTKNERRGSEIYDYIYHVEEFLDMLRHSPEFSRVVKRVYRDFSLGSDPAKREEKELLWAIEQERAEGITTEWA